jgi:hypothetical protein
LIRLQPSTLAQPLTLNNTHCQDPPAVATLASMIPAFSADNLATLP